MNVALIGAGKIGRIRAEVIRQSESRLVAVHDANDIAAAKLGLPVSLDFIMTAKDINAVVICTPTKYHMPIAVSALHAGKHVLCEKPLGRTLQEAKLVVQNVLPGQILHSGFNYRHLSHVKRAKKIIESGVLGDLMFFRSRFGNGGRPGYGKEWCTQKDLGGGGVTIEQAIHVFDLISFLFGDPERIVANMDLCYHGFPDTEDNVFCMIKTSGGTATVHVSWTQWTNLFEVEIFGTEGYLRLEGRDGSYGPPRLYHGIRNDDHTRPFEHEIDLPDESSWALDWAEFEQEVESGINGAYGLMAQRMVEAAYKSVDKGWVNI
jgi:predicted dehydrogenase